MYTPKTFTSLRHNNVSLRERRLVFSSGGPDEDQEQPEAGTDTPQRDPVTERLTGERGSTRGQLNRASGEAVNAQGTPEGELQRLRQENQNLANQRHELQERLRAAEAGDTTPDQRTPAATPETPTTTPASTGSNGRTSWLRSPLDQKQDHPIANAAATGGLLGGGLAAGLNAPSLASVPGLGSVASGIGSALSYVSAGISNTLTSVGAPAQLSVLSNPLLWFPTAAVGGLWMLGKGRISWLKSFHKHNPGHPKTEEVLKRIKQLEESSLIGKVAGTLNEGTKVIAGIPKKIIDVGPKVVGNILGTGTAMLSKMGDSLGMPKDVKKAVGLGIKSSGWGAVGGIGSYAAISALGGPAAIPLGVAAGLGVAAWRFFGKHKGKSPEVALAGA